MSYCTDCYNYQITLSLDVLVDQKSRPAARSIRNGCENRRNTIGKHTQRVLEREGCGGRSPCSPSTRFPARAAPRRGGCPAGEAARSGERLKAAATGDNSRIPYRTRHHFTVRVATRSRSKIRAVPPPRLAATTKISLHYGVNTHSHSFDTLKLFLRPINSAEYTI